MERVVLFGLYLSRDVRVHLYVDHIADLVTDVEKLLVDVGAVKLGDQRLQRKRDDDEPSTSGIRQGAPTGDDDDSDWD
jgi:hypothetical protein